MKARVLLSTLALLGVLAAAAAAKPGPSQKPPADAAKDPCQTSEARHLLCPNLRIGPPADMYLDLSGGRELLRATSDVRSRGRGPMELRGKRNGPRTMRTNQRIYRVGGGHIDVRSRATLHFTNVGYYFGGSYWKVHQLARFELFHARPDGASYGEPVRTSPKLNYCLRDLERTKPGPRSPEHRHYPGCNQNPHRNRVTLGTSIGWSDIYPSDYDKQYIDVTGLRGCFAFRMTVDPFGLLDESNENDNSSQKLVRLPFTGDTGC